MAQDLNHNRYCIQLRKDGRSKKLMLGRLIYAAHNPDFDLYDRSLDVDHINRDSTDDRIENLRAITRGENMLNRILPNKTGNKYIFQIPSGSYVVTLWKRKEKKHYTKTFKTLEEAISHRDEMIPIIKGDDMEFLPK